MRADRAAPSATYRIQLRGGVDFDTVAGLAGYLADLGVSHVYLSPSQQAAPGSTHGYDIVDPTRLDDTLGGAAGFTRMGAALRALGLGVVLDIVPNHLSTATPHNRAWWDVLRRGCASPHARWFDVDWDHPRNDGKVLLPVLGDEYPAVLAAGHLAVVDDGGELAVRVYDSLLPLDPASLADGADAEALNADRVALDALLRAQHYRLAFWRTAGADLNYRRFFDIDGLIGVRVEDEAVFADTHRAFLALVESGVVAGLRVDHPDGLRDPEQYFQRLRQAAPRAWIVAEKILERDEVQPTSWPIDGTTGYDVLNLIGGLFVDARGERALTDLYAGFTGEAVAFDALVERKKRLVLAELFVSDVERVVTVGIGRPDLRAFGREPLQAAVEELVVQLPVYRTYVRPPAAASAADRVLIDTAVVRAGAARPDLVPLLALLGDVLTGRAQDGPTSEFVARFQQLTGPAMAKGLEDTAFYCFHRLISLCEVGGDPAHFGTGLDEFHAACTRLQTQWPSTMTTTSTHDTKRSEDVRVRVSLLSEIPEQWASAVQRWSARCQRHWGRSQPDRAAEYLLYQTLVGAWPIGEDRLLRYLEKAAREAKVHTSWRAPNADYERAISGFARGVIGDGEQIADLQAFLEPLLPAARTHALAQVLVKLCAPGVPDVYQGNELWDHSLTDPDNRRPVDFAQRRRLLAELAALTPEQVVGRAAEGLPKLWLTRHALHLRRERPDDFGAAAVYVPLAAHGPHAERVVAFGRGRDVVAVAPRLILGRGPSWAGTRLALPPGSWRNRLTGEPPWRGEVEIEALLQRFPVALLVRE